MKKLTRPQMNKVMGAKNELGDGNSCYKCCRANGVCSACSWSYSGAICDEGTLHACQDTTYPCTGT